MTLDMDPSTKVIMRITPGLVVNQISGRSMLADGKVRVRVAVPLPSLAPSQVMEISGWVTIIDSNAPEDKRLVPSDEVGNPLRFPADSDNTPLIAGERSKPGSPLDPTLPAVLQEDSQTTGEVNWWKAPLSSQCSLSKVSLW